MADVIRSLLTNFTITLFVLGLIAAALVLTQRRKPLARTVVAEELLAWYIFFSIGVGYFYNFIMHAFFGDLIAAYIGWANSPFQFEVAVASLGFSAVGLWAFKKGFDLRLAAILGPAIFAWGAALGHIYQMRQTGNLAAGNTGVVLYSDVLLPFIGFGLLWMRGRRPT
jgi:hypothetical protein